MKNLSTKLFALLAMFMLLIPSGFAWSDWGSYHRYPCHYGRYNGGYNGGLSNGLAGGLIGGLIGVVVGGAIVHHYSTPNIPPQTYAPPQYQYPSQVPQQYQPQYQNQTNPPVQCSFIPDSNHPGLYQRVCQ